MSNGTLAKVTAKKAAEVCQRFALPDEAKPLVREEMTPQEFLDLLVEKQQYYTAISFLAHALPKREAIWWSLQCARAVAGAAPAPVVATALQVAEKWVANPSEDFRRPAVPAWEAATLGTPAGCVAAAVAFTGGSLGPPNVPTIPPGDYAPALAAAGAVMLAAVADPLKIDAALVRFLGLGRDVASGVSTWK
jgi:hypothetical protein